MSDRLFSLGLYIHHCSQKDEEAVGEYMSERAVVPVTRDIAVMGAGPSHARAGRRRTQRRINS